MDRQTSATVFLAVEDQLLGGLELADDLPRRVRGAFHGEVPGPAWRVRTLIHPGPVYGIHVSSAKARTKCQSTSLVNSANNRVRPVSSKFNPQHTPRPQSWREEGAVTIRSS